MQRFGKGSGVTRGTMEAAFTFMATSLRPRALDALWMRINPHGADSVTFQQVAKLCVGIDVPPRARPEVRVKLETIRQKLQQRYPPGQGVAALRRGFAVIDRDRSGALSAKELVQFLDKLGLRLTPYDADVLIAAFDRNGDGAVSLQEFCRAVRGPMSSTRAALVTQAFRQIDSDGSGSLTLPELTERYDASKHPEVIAGRLTAEQVVADFVAPWDTRMNVADATGESRSGDGVITLAEFLDYYDDTSATIDDDEYFELMIRNCWHLSGGEGAAQNTSCKRVLVEFKDGTQRVVEITNDLGLKFDNMQAVRRRLEQQGVKDIAVVKLK
uniref:EF-hand domain-containing protein n=1 Tax=Neobodo designis TaxID=312471 RepID=A0A7S1M7Y2_NEODS